MNYECDACGGSSPIYSEAGRWLCVSCWKSLPAVGERLRINKSPEFMNYLAAVADSMPRATRWQRFNNWLVNWLERRP